MAQIKFDSQNLGCINQDNSEEVKNYKTWVQSYKPTFKTIIFQQIAQEWIVQAQNIVDIINKNTQALQTKEEIKTLKFTTKNKADHESLYLPIHYYKSKKMNMLIKIILESKT